MKFPLAYFPQAMFLFQCLVTSWIEAVLVKLSVCNFIRLLIWKTQMRVHFSPGVKIACNLQGYYYIFALVQEDKVKYMIE